VRERYFRQHVEIGQHLIESRRILKENRVWLAWLRAEFQFPRRHADRFIAVPKIARSAQRCAVFGLPLSAIFSLRKASHKTVKLIGNRIEAGESAPSAREAARLARSPDTNIQSWPYGLRPPPETNAPTRTYASVTTTLTEREPPLNAERFQEIQAHDLANQIATLRQRLENAEPEAVLSALRPEERRWLIEDAEEIMDFLGALVDALKPKAVS
jgi:hypothetical protein